jgi:quinoprotein glucose dehydrogenase
MVHHDIWDYDTPMAPNLIDITVNGRLRRAIAQTTKQGFIYTFDRATGEPIWPIVETPVLQSDVPGEETSKTQPIPSRPAPYSQQGLEEDDLIDYTPEIKAAALHLARLCRMGPYYVPPSAIDGTSKYHCSWYAPGASGGVNIDGGAAIDPQTGMMYVGSQSGLSTTEVGKDPCSEFRYTQAGGNSPRNSCGKLGAPAPPPGYVPPPPGAGRAGGGRGGGGRGGGAATTSYKDASPGTSSIAGISILKPKTPFELGGITAYNMNTGEKVWRIPNGGRMTTPAPNPNSPDAALFAGVTLPLQGPSRGQPQVITTRTLMIYGTGRSAGAAPDGVFRIHAVDKASGKEVGAVASPANTSAVPMTFLLNGRQYIVFAVGAGAATLANGQPATNPPSLVALTLPR